MRIRFYLKVVSLLMIVALIGCGGNSSSNSPEGVVRELFKLVKQGEMTKAKSLMSGGNFDGNDADELREVFGGAEDIEVEVVSESELEASVTIVLKTTKGTYKSKRSLDLVFQDGSWRINYSGPNWPVALCEHGYKSIPTDATGNLKEFGRDLVNYLIDADTSVIFSHFRDSYENVKKRMQGLRVPRMANDQEELARLKRGLEGVKYKISKLDWLKKGQFGTKVTYRRVISDGNLLTYRWVNILVRSTTESGMSMNIELPEVLEVEGEIAIADW